MEKPRSQPQDRPCGRQRPGVSHPPPFPPNPGTKKDEESATCSLHPTNLSDSCSVSSNVPKSPASLLHRFTLKMTDPGLVCAQTKCGKPEPGDLVLLHHDETMMTL